MEVKGHQREIDKFTDEAQTLQNLTSESRVGHFVSQLTSRYQTLLTSGKVSLKVISRSLFGVESGPLCLSAHISLPGSAHLGQGEFEGYFT